ncbi:unannotated protein [freshwater metagenome]|uniref:Unannotated protein n=1 Tax=freshwater metagenome TaxID=449393 RepID=A0A6J6MRJ0_9ZZZZ
MHRAGHAQELLDRPRDQLRALTQDLELIGVSHEVVHRMRDGVPRGLITRDHKQQEVVPEVTII